MAKTQIISTASENTFFVILKKPLGVNPAGIGLINLKI